METQIVKDGAWEVEFIRLNLLVDVDKRTMVRLYRDRPDGAQLQIRQPGRVMQVASASLALEEMISLAAGLEEIIASLKS